MGATGKNVASIIATLPTLTKADLAAVRGAADALLGPQAAPTDTPATPLFEAVTRALGLRLGFAAFSQTATYKPYKRGEQAIADFLGTAFQAPRDRVTLNAMMQLLIECLTDDLKARRVPLSLGTLCNNLERAPQVFRDAFPGYIESGHGSIILRQITGKNKGATFS
jgi:hypothetical protein